MSLDDAKYVAWVLNAASYCTQAALACWPSPTGPLGRCGLAGAPPYPFVSKGELGAIKRVRSLGLLHGDVATARGVGSHLVLMCSLHGPSTLCKEAGSVMHALQDVVQAAPLSVTPPWPAFSSLSSLPTGEHQPRCTRSGCIPGSRSSNSRQIHPWPSRQPAPHSTLACSTFT